MKSKQERRVSGQETALEDVLRDYPKHVATSLAQSIHSVCIDPEVLWEESMK